MLRFSALSPNIRSESATECEVCFSLLSAYISIYSVQSWAERATHMKKIYNNPGLGVSRPATSVIVHFFSEEKWWQIQPFKCSYFLHTTSERIDVSLCGATNYPQREKQLAGDSWLWGIQPLWRSQTHWLVWNPVNLTAPSTQVAQQRPYWCNADTYGKYSSTAIFTVFPLFFFFVLEVLLPTQLQMAFTLQQHASSVPRLVACSQSGGKIFYYHI